jgi:hypothetical protein
MKITTKHTLAAAAVAGLLTGAAASAQARIIPSGSGVKVSTLAEKDTHSCKGQSTCKGQSGCKSSGDSCKSKSDCKGKSGCATDGSKK